MHRLSLYSALFLLTCSALMLAACRPGATSMVDIASTYDSYGEALTPEAAVPVQSVMADYTGHLGETKKLEGVIVSVCRMKGCWFALQTDSDLMLRVEVPRDAEGNYVFTVPTEINGRRVIVEGLLTERTIDGALPHHLAEDAGEQPTEEMSLPKSELLLTTRGVLVEKVAT